MKPDAEYPEEIRNMRLVRTDLSGRGDSGHSNQSGIYF